MDGICNTHGKTKLLVTIPEKKNPFRRYLGTDGEMGCGGVD
jgi:hypothetical protein